MRWFNRGAPSEFRPPSVRELELGEILKRNRAAYAAGFKVGLRSPHSDPLTDAEDDAEAALGAIKAFLAGGLLAFALFGSAEAGPLEDAKAAGERSDYATELHILRPLAGQGNATAQFRLGGM